MSLTTRLLLPSALLALAASPTWAANNPAVDMHFAVANPQCVDVTLKNVNSVIPVNVGSVVLEIYQRERDSSRRLGREVKVIPLGKRGIRPLGSVTLHVCCGRVKVPPVRIYHLKVYSDTAPSKESYLTSDWLFTP